MEHKNTIVINIFGVVSKNKSALSSFILSQLSDKGYDCKFVSEFSDNANVVDCQMFTTGKRIRDIQSAYGTVDFIITDTPIVEDCIYCEKNLLLTKLTMDEFNKFNNYNICLNDDFPTVSNISQGWLQANDIPYTIVNNTDEGFSLVVNGVLAYSKSYYVNTPFTSTLDVRSQLWAEAQNDGFMILDQSNCDEVFYQYTFNNKKIKYIIRISDKPCDESTWMVNFGVNASDISFEGCYELKYISYVVDDGTAPKPVLKNYNKNGITYKEVYFSTVTNDKYDLYNFKKSISNLRSCDVDEALVMCGKNITLAHIGQCIINDITTLYDNVTFEPVLFIKGTRKKDGKEYTTTNPYKDIIEFEPK